MANINVEDVAKESTGKDFDEFVNKFQDNIKNLAARNKYDSIISDKDYQLDADGFIIGDVWSESIAAEIMTLNGFVPTVERIQMLITARELYQDSTVPSDYKATATALAITPADFLKLFPKFPIVYFTRWGNLRKPRNLEELLANPIRTRR